MFQQIHSLKWDGLSAWWCAGLEVAHGVLRGRESQWAEGDSVFQLRSQDYRSFIFIYSKFELGNLTNEQPLAREGHTA